MDGGDPQLSSMVNVTVDVVDADYPVFSDNSILLVQIQENLAPDDVVLYTFQAISSLSVSYFLVGEWKLNQIINIKSSLRSRFYIEARHEWWELSPRLRAWATQLRRNVAAMPTLCPH